VSKLGVVGEDWMRWIWSCVGGRWRVLFIADNHHQKIEDNKLFEKSPVSLIV
jgi:hypothetical protein